MAEKIFAEAEQLCSEGDADSCRLALVKYERALALWKFVDDREQQATVLRRMGRIYSGFGDSQRALEYFVRSQKLCETFASVRCNLETRNELSPLYVVLGDIDKASKQCEGALKLSRDSANRAGEAQALYNIGDIFYARGNQEKAIEQFQQALSIWKDLKDEKGQAQAFLYLGYSFSDLSNTEQAAISYAEALALFENVNDIRGRAQTLTAIGHLHNANGESQAALEHYDRAAPLFRRTGDRLEEARVLNGMGFVYNKLGEPRRAIEYCQQARRLFRAVDYKNGESTTLALIAKIELAIGDHAAALRDLQESLRIIIGDDERLEAALISLIGMARASSGDISGAFEASRRALELNRKVKDRYRESYTLGNIAYLQERTGAKQEALKSYNDALALTKAIGDRPGQSLMLFSIARVLRDLGDLDQARRNTEEALEINDSLRTKVSGDEMRALYSATVHRLYDFYVDLLMRLYASRQDESFVVKAFEASERGRARSLLEMLSEGRKNIREGVDAALLQREQDLQRRIRESTSQRIQLAEDVTSTKKVAELEKQLDELATEYQQLQGRIRASSPRYSALVQPVPLSLRQVQQNVLDPETLLLEYSLGEERSYVWAITHDSIKSFALPARAQIETLSRRAYELLTANNLSVRNETVEQRQARTRLAEVEFARTSATLSQMILGPVAGELRQKRIVIVADGALQYLPFPALPSPVSLNTPAQPLIVEHEIVLLPSASAVWLMREELRGRQPAPKAVAILADAVFDKGDARLAATAKGVSRNRSKISPELVASNTQTRALRSFSGLGSGRAALGRLPFSRREADAIRALLPEKDVMLALGFRASLATATSPELSQYRYVHFATHGLLNSEQPGLSGILLSSYDESGKRQNGFLQLHDVYNLKLSADLVVLSACETALGKDIKGEGLVGLTRGFMYAGVPRIVASLWNVDDAATAELMGMFYKSMLTEGKRPADALRTAQVNMWRTNQWSSPYYWAAFTLQGEWK